MAKNTAKPLQPNFKTKYTVHERTAPIFKYTDESETVAGQSVSMRDMIAKYTRGEIPPLAQAAFHGTDVDINLHDGSKPIEDLVDVSNLAEQVNASKKQKKASERLKISDPKESDKEPASEAMKVTEERERSESPEGA